MDSSTPAARIRTGVQDLVLHLSRARAEEAELLKLSLTQFTSKLKAPEAPEL
jgi:hypothetical protein